MQPKLFSADDLVKIDLEGFQEEAADPSAEIEVFDLNGKKVE